MTVLEGPELRLDELGMGRGWPNAQRAGTDVTERLLGRAREQARRAPELERLKERIAGRIDAGPLSLNRVVVLTAELMPGRRASERLSIAETAVWEMLHERAVELLAGEDPQTGPVPESDWQAHLLSWSPGPRRRAASDRPRHPDDANPPAPEPRPGPTRPGTDRRNASAGAHATTSSIIRARSASEANR